MACEICDTIVTVPELAPGDVAACPRCSTTVDRFGHPGTQVPLALSIAALVLFACSLLFPFLGMEAQGHSSSMSLMGAGLSLVRSGEWLLGAVVFCMTVGVPIALMTLIFFLSAGRQTVLASPTRRWLARTLSQLEHWFLADVFFVGVLVCLTKIVAIARVDFGMSFWAYIGAATCAWFAVHSLDLHRILHADALNQDHLGASGRAGEIGLASCEVCQRLVKATGDMHCPSCGAHCELRKRDSLQRTLAWLVAAIVLFIPANTLPMTETITLGRSSASTVGGSAISMWSHGSHVIASVIFLASVVVPILKIMSIALLCWSASRRRKADGAKLTRLYRITELVGRWSMIDIFVVALLVALIQIGSLMAIRPGPAALAFMGVVLCTLFSARAFDPRLLWDSPRPRV